MRAPSPHLQHKKTKKPEDSWNFTPKTLGLLQLKMEKSKKHGLGSYAGKIFFMSRTS